MRYAEVIKPFDTNERADNYQREYTDNYIARNIALKQIDFEEVSQKLKKDDSGEPDDGFTPGIVAERIDERLMGMMPDEMPDEMPEEAADPSELEALQEQLKEILSEIESSKAEMEQIKEEAARIIDDANSQAAITLSEADVEAEERKQKAVEEGFEEGKSRGLSEAQSIIDEKIASLDAEREQLQKDYEAKALELEPFFTEMLIKYVEKLTGIFAEEKKDLIMHLLDTAVKGRKSSDEYIIRVSSADYPVVMYSKEQVRQSLPENTVFEIIEDPLLQKNQCLIETETRIFDCSLNEQLSGLIEDLKILSQRD